MPQKFGTIPVLTLCLYGVAQSMGLAAHFTMGMQGRLRCGQHCLACRDPRESGTRTCCAGAGEIDQGLFDLLQQNIDSARQAGQSAAADFMEKVLVAAKRYSV